MSEDSTFDLVRMDVEGQSALFVYGDVDALSAPHLHEGLGALINAHPTMVLVDLANVTFLDSSGLSVLVVADRHLEEAGGELRLVSVPPSIVRLFHITGLAERFGIAAEAAQ